MSVTGSPGSTTEVGRTSDDATPDDATLGDAAPGEPTPDAARRAEPSLRLRGVSKAFGYAGDRVWALDEISLDVGKGEFVCVVGASGCGKSTLLNLVAGLERPSSGTVERLDGDAALMFQDAALFPWLTVARNVDLALRLSGVAKAARAPRVAELLASVQLSDFADKRPHELSGGMRSRVALARALAQERRVLLMDEPFGALDAITRDLLHDELERVWREANLAVVFVTHNVREAVRLGDRVILLSSRPGRVAEEFRIDLSRPRESNSPQVAELSTRITDRLREEVRRHGGNATD